MVTKKPSICRLCSAYCPIEVTIEDGRVRKVVGARESPLYNGYTCAKGRALPAMHNGERRLLHSLKKMPDGTRVKISSDDAVAEIADKLSDIIRRHGPRSVAFYTGNAAMLYPASTTLAAALLTGIGSPSFYTAGTIDQPGIYIANALHGVWLGGPNATGDADAILLLGGNPVISKQYFSQNPGSALIDSISRGAQLIVVDPRRTETARRAQIHLQILPGEDPTVLAGLLHLIFESGRVNTEFTDAHVSGIEILRNAVKRFDPDYVSHRAGIPAALLLRAAHILGNANRAFIAGGTGPSMAMRGTLSAYLQLCLKSVRGLWAKAGDAFVKSRVLFPSVKPKAQASPPFLAWGFGESGRIRNLQNSVAGLPTAAMCEEILMPGDGQIRALLTTGNPMLAFPDSALTKAALESLELLVTPNVELSETSRLAHYVVATKMTLETAASTHFIEAVGIAHPGYGWDEPYANYTPAVVDPPQGADLIEDWQLFYRIGKRLGVQLKAVNLLPNSEGQETLIDMNHEPSSDEILDIVCAGSAVPLDAVKRYPQGHVFEEAREIVQQGDAHCAARLDVANQEMMSQLLEVAAEDFAATRARNGDYRFLLIPRRLSRSFNSMFRGVPGLSHEPANPAMMHSEDLKELGLTPGDLVEIRSRHGAVRAVIDGDDSLRPGVLTLSHGFGLIPGEDGDPLAVGANVNALLRVDDEFDPVTGMPRMGAVPIRVTRAAV